VLAGGAARRMDGIDKGLLEIAGKPLALWVAEALRPQVSTLLISANRNLERYAELGWPVVEDAVPGHQGPLSGIAAALARAGTPWLLVSPCDTPLIPSDLAQRLAAVHGAAVTDIAIAADSSRQHPLHALIPRTAGDDLRDYLAAGMRSVTGWLGRHRVAVALFDEAPSPFANCNRHDEIEAVRARLGSRRRRLCR
jgi:molybdopterin-guanine dinucleotide biosynthesis protein A